MTGVLDWVTAFFDPLGTLGVLIGIFIFFYIDAIVFPTLPELVAILAYSGNHTVPFAIAILITIVMAEILGLTTLYLIVSRVKVPKKIESAINRYTRFLIVKDEKIILINRIAPVLPFMGAFAAVCHWDFKKCVLYTVIGGVVKYSLILMASAFFFAYLQSDTAFVVSIVMVLVVIAISLIISFTKRDKILGPGTAGDYCQIDPKEKS